MTGDTPHTFVFDSTNGALWAEEIAGEHGIPVDVVPAPPESRAVCDLALLVGVRDATALREALEVAGVPFRPWPDQGPSL